MDKDNILNKVKWKYEMGWESSLQEKESKLRIIVEI